MASVTLSPDSMVHHQRFAADDTALFVKVENPDWRRRAEYEVVGYVGGHANSLVSRVLSAGKYLIEEIPIDGGEIVNVGRTDLTLTWPVSSEE